MKTRPLILLIPFALIACGQEGEVNPPTQPAPPVTTPEAYTPSEGRGGGVGQPGTGPVSFVGRWAADVAWCAAPRGESRPIEITPTRFLGYENTCDIVTVDQVPAGYEAVLRCQSEGQTRTERVRMAVSGDVLDLTWLDRDGASVKLSKCTTLAETPERAPAS